MLFAATMQEGRAWYLERAGTSHVASELLERWLLLHDNQTYARFLDALRSFERGIFPFVASRSGSPLAHDVSSLPRATLLRSLLSGRRIFQEDYFALVGTVAATMVDPMAPLDGVEPTALFSTVDRMLLLGKDWPMLAVDRGASADLFRRLREVLLPSESDIFTPLGLATEGPGYTRFGGDYLQLTHMTGGALRILTAATTLRRGRKTAGPNDAIDAGYVFLYLFEPPCSPP